MSDGHCDHCSEWCHFGKDLGDGPITTHKGQQLSDWCDGVWQDGQCDLCAEIAKAVSAERARIVEAIRVQLVDKARTGPGRQMPYDEGMADGFDLALKVAQGVWP